MLCLEGCFLLKKIMQILLNEQLGNTCFRTAVTSIVKYDWYHMLSFFSFLLFKMQIKFWKKRFMLFLYFKMNNNNNFLNGLRHVVWEVIALKRPSFDSGWSIQLPGAGGCCISQLVAKYLSQLHQLVESSHPVTGLVEGMSCTFFAAEMGIRTLLIHLCHFCKAYQRTCGKQGLVGKLPANAPWRHKRVVWSNRLMTVK